MFERNKDLQTNAFFVFTVWTPGCQEQGEPHLRAPPACLVGLSPDKSLLGDGDPGFRSASGVPHRAATTPISFRSSPFRKTGLRRLARAS